MKRACAALMFMFFAVPYGYTANIDDASQKISDLLNNASYKNDPRIEITEFKYRPESRSESNFKGKIPMVIEEGWRTNISIKNVSADRAICTITGRFKLVNGKYDKSSETILFHGHVDPGSTVPYTGGFRANLKNANRFASYLVETECEVVAALGGAEKEEKVLGLLKKANYKKDVGVKVIEASFNKTGSDQYWDTWESTIKLRSCYTTKMECSATGRWETADESINISRASNPYFGVLPLIYIDKEATD